MIDVDDKLIVTKEINEIMLRYAMNTLYKDLLIKICVSKDGNISSLLERINENYDGGMFTDADVYFELAGRISAEIENLDKTDKTAFYFYYLNKQYIKLLESDDFESNDSNDAGFSASFGRYIASKLYEPEESNLHSNLLEMLENQISMFSLEFDFSTGTDDYTRDEIEEMIESQLGFLR